MHPPLACDACGAARRSGQTWCLLCHHCFVPLPPPPRPPDARTRGGSDGATAAARATAAADAARVRLSAVRANVGVTHASLHRRREREAAQALQEAHPQARLVTFLGGHNLPVHAGTTGLLELHPAILFLSLSGQRLMELPTVEVVEVGLGGAGAVQTGGGFIGGGALGEGAAEGMAVAAVLNTLTTRTRHDVVLRLGLRAGEGLFRIHDMDRLASDVWLSSLRTAMRARRFVDRDPG